MKDPDIRREVTVIILLSAGCTVITCMGIIAALVLGGLVWR